MRIVMALCVLSLYGCTKQSPEPRSTATTEVSQHDGDSSEVISLVASAKVNSDKLVLRMRLLNQNQFPLYVRSDHYWVDWYAEEEGADPPARYWGGNVIYRTKPSTYGSMGEMQAGPFSQSRPLLTAISPNDSVVVNLHLHIPPDLQKKGLAGDSLYVSLPYWRDIQPIAGFVRIVGGRKNEYVYHDSQFNEKNIGRSVQLGLVQDSVSLPVEGYNRLSAGVVNRIQTWIHIFR